jgi:large subunit ribosomal protein L2
MVDFGQEKIGIPGKIIAIEYDPFRTSFLALVEYENKKKGYVICPQGVAIGDPVLCAEKTDVVPGNRMKLVNIPVGTMVFNLEIMPGQGGKAVRSAGSAAKVLAHEDKYAHIEMPSKEVRKILSQCFATVGAPSHQEWRYVHMKKAGTSRKKGKRPTVRGSAMNPVDHPHGGGEGRAPIGLAHPKTPWGLPARGVRTRKRKYTNKFILQRRKKK